VFKKIGFIMVVLFLAGSCAGVKVTRLTSESDYKEGLRFYRSYPYLLVIKDGNGNLQSSIIYLPKRDEEYVIKVHPGFGSVDAKFKFDGGWNLTEFGQVIDSKIPEMLTALTGALKTLESTGPGQVPVPGLYQFEFDTKTGLVIDMKLIYQFK
jgi:hypothetical protein